MAKYGVVSETPNLVVDIASGSFTPTVTFATVGDFVPTYTTQKAAYRRVGDMVYIEIYIDFDTNAYTTTSGAFRVAGLPFACVTDAVQDRWPLNPLRCTNVTFSTSAINLLPHARSAQSFLEFSLNNSNAALTSCGTTQFPASKTGILLWITGWYPIA